MSSETSTQTNFVSSREIGLNNGNSSNTGKKSPVEVFIRFTADDNIVVAAPPGKQVKVENGSHLAVADGSHVAVANDTSLVNNEVNFVRKEKIVNSSCVVPNNRVTTGSPVEVVIPHAPTQTSALEVSISGQCSNLRSVRITKQ